MTAPLLTLAPLRIEAFVAAAGARRSRVVRIGMGPVRAAATCARLAAEPSGHAAVAVTGVAGALVDGLGAGDLVVADRILRPSGEVVATLPSAGLVAAELRRAGLTARVGAVVSTDRVVRGDAGRRRLAGIGAVAVDMESAAAMTQPWNLPVTVVRAVSDRPGQALWSPSTVVGGVRALRALRGATAVLERWATVAGPRHVLLASPRSFCAGVERAIETVVAGLDRFGTPLYVRRQIVHNDHVVADLERRGAVFVHEVDEVPCGATVILSAHGASPSVHAAAAARRLRVVDATCPLVAKVHAEVRRFAERGRTIVLIGHAGHDEIDGTLGEAPGIHLIESPADVGSLEIDDDTPVAYVTQTTLARDEVDATVTALRHRFADLVGPRASDICYATQNRQDAVLAVVDECDLLLVVGSPGSSNSRRLVEVARRAGRRAELVARPEDLCVEWLGGVTRIGVSAGASTPESLVGGLVDTLDALGGVEVHHRAVRPETVSFSLPSEVR